MKNFWKRLGVIGGGFLSLRLLALGTWHGGELGGSAMRGAHGEEDMARGRACELYRQRDNDRRGGRLCGRTGGARDEYTAARGEVGSSARPDVHAFRRELAR